MSDKQTFTRDEFLTDVRGANGTRAQWFALMLEEAEKHGIDPDEFCEDTIYKFGLGRGKKYGVCEGNPGKMAEMLYGSNGQDVFEMELAEKTDERGVLKFHFCPLAHTWKAMGLPAERVAELCRLACYSDFARADCAGVNLHFANQIGRGDDICELVFTPKKDGDPSGAEACRADAAANAAGQIAGAMRKRIDPVYDSWVDICAHFHAVLDYPDEDIDPFELSRLESALQASSRTLSALLSSCHRGRMVRSGVRVTILGSPNAGKSSLLNALSGFDRVIVTDIPGTTRDTVEQTVTLGRHLVRLVDTAGIRDTQDMIEKIGVDRSMEAARDCDAALFVVDASRPLTDEDRRAMDAALEAPEAIAILNKQDLPGAIEPSDLPFSYIIPVSCKDGTGFDLLEQAFDMLFPDDAPCDGSLLTNARQADAILRAKRSVDSAVRSLRAGVTPDAVLVDLESAMDALGEVTGRTMREDITNRIFERFCVGK